MPGNISKRWAVNVCASKQNFTWHEFILFQTMLYPNNPWAHFGVVAVRRPWWPFPLGRRPAKWH